MLPVDLKLACQQNCYVQLPENFVKRETNLKPGAIVSLRSIQSENEICAVWDGLLTSGNFAQLDLDFATTNNLKDELVIISLMDKINITECSNCRTELINANDYSILSQHVDINLLDTCRLVYPNLIIPIAVTQHVKVFVKVTHIEPNNTFGYLTKSTEMEFHHNLENLPQPKANDKSAKEDTPINDPLPIVSCSLGISYRPRFYLGSLLILGDPGSGKSYYLKKTLDKYSKYHSTIYNCKQLRGKRPESVKKILTELIDNACVNQPYILALDDFDSILSSNSKNEDDKGQAAVYTARLVDIFLQLFSRIEREVSSGNLIHMMATCCSLESLDKRFSQPMGRRYFNATIKIDAPDLVERQTIIQNMIKEYENFNLDIDEDQMLNIAKRTNSFVPADLRILVERAVISACSRSTSEFSSELTNIQYEDLVGSIKDYTPINLRDVSLQPKGSKNLSHVGGMKEIKEKLLKAVLLPMKYSKLYKRCPIKPQKSVLLYGPPGCGKTLVAEALINQESLNSICVRGPELLSKYIGASEAAVRNLFRRAFLARPCVIFFDEFESLVARRGADSTGVTDRIVNQFLTLMDGVEALSDEVFIIATTSRPDMIDPAVVRPGRLDTHIYCPPPNEQDRKEIFEVLSRDVNLASVDIETWAHKLDGFTGADIKSLLFAAQLKALHEKIGPSDIENLSKLNNEATEDLEINVHERHLEESFAEMADEVVERGRRLEDLYPRFPRLRGDRVSMKATLA